MKTTKVKAGQEALPGFDITSPAAPAPNRRRNGPTKRAGGGTNVVDLRKAARVPVPDFSHPKRPKTCLEVDFPIVPVNALSELEGNAGKPIYQMSKWWARRRSSVFRAMLIAAATEAPAQRNADGS